MNQYHGPPIQVDPEKLGGTPTITDTRMPVRDLFVHLARGGSVQEFADGSGLDVEEVRSVLIFAIDDLGNNPHAAERAKAWEVEQAQEAVREAQGFDLAVA